MRVAIVSDTHMPPRGPLPPGVYQQLEAADLVLHAGDVTSPDVLDELAAYAPLHAVRGNCDGWDIVAPSEVALELEGVRIAMIHDSGPAAGRASRMKRRFPGVDVVVFGHSHIPLVSHEEGIVLINPGSATDKRRQPVHTMAVLWLPERRAEIVVV